MQTTVVGNVSWDFGDGHVASGRSVSHTYPYAGIYRVQVLQGGAPAAQVDLTVRIPDSLYAGSSENTTASHGPPTTAPPTNVTLPRGPVARPGGFLHFLSENPLALIVVLGGVVGSVMFAVVKVRKKRGQTPVKEEEEAKPAPEPAPVQETQDSLEAIMPGAEPYPDEEAEAPPPVPEPENHAEEVDLDAVTRGPPESKPAPEAVEDIDEAAKKRVLEGSA